MNYLETSENLKKIILPFLEEEGMVVVELRLMRTGQGMVLRLLVDKREGGINLQDCARLNEKIGSLLDTQDIIKERYALEVSSPGVDRDLLTKDDFSRCVNRRVRVFLNDCINGKMEIEGWIKEVAQETVYLDAFGEVIEITLSKITKARQIVEGT